MKKFTADFETNVSEEDCRIWAYALCEIGNINNFIYGNNMEDFISFCANKKENYTLYFHNLKFDQEYILNYLLRNDYVCIKDKKDAIDKSFTCLIGSTGQVYSLEIFFSTKNRRHVNKVTIYDSLKIIPLSVDKIAKDFNLPIKKLELDYNTYREKNHILTDHEIDYIRNDVEIMARAMEIMFSEGLNKMTIGACALADYKTLYKKFDLCFPKIVYDIDQDIRQSYKGGFTYLSPKYKEKETGKGMVLDVNSLYPSVLQFKPLPWGQPVFFEGEYEPDLLYPLYVQMLTCEFRLKKDKIPTIQLKDNIFYAPNEYVESSDGDAITLCLTNIDLKLFFDHYDVKVKKYHGGWKFKQMRGMFNTYIDKWSNKKILAKKEGNGALYRIAKLMLNSLYG